MGVAQLEPHSRGAKTQSRPLALTQPRITQGLTPKDITAPLGIPTSLGHAESVGGTAGPTPVS